MLETIIQCTHCQEELNEADWQANDLRCLHCGRAIWSPSLGIARPRLFEPVKARLEFRRFFQPVRTALPLPEARLYA